MSECCCIESSDDGVPSGGGGARDFLFRIDADRVSTSVFPVITTMISATILAGRLAADGDMIVMKLGGNVQNAGGGGATVSPFIGIDAVFAWGATSAIIGAGVTAAWDLDVMITRKSALTFTLAGRAQVHNATTALTGLGSLALANLGGPIAAPNADPACNWAIAQQLIFNMSASAAGVSFRIKSGYAEVLSG